MSKPDTGNLKSVQKKPPFLDFFAGSGLVSEALKSHFDTVWANDIDKKKEGVFCANHPSDIFHRKSIKAVTGRELPPAVLSWGSFPCQDLSLAGNLNGIDSSRSGLVWEWLRVMDEMPESPPIVVAENVVGLLSSQNGEHYKQLHTQFVKRGYKVGALVIDAACWVPQSRKRVFVIAVDKNINTEKYESSEPLWCHPVSVVKVSKEVKGWVWWKLPEPSSKRKSLEDLIDFTVPYDEKEKSRKNLALIPDKHKNKLNSSYKEGKKVFPGYKRIRNQKQVLELRFDGLAGCLRTPQGGSSRQVIVLRNNGKFVTRLLSVKETAALMGVRKSYKIPGSYNDGYKAMGDAVAVPVVRHLAKHLLAPIAKTLEGHKRDE